MINKKTKQVATKKQHKEQLKSKKRLEPNLVRLAPSLKIKPTILIVCEGKNTEPSYFQQFKLTSATIKPIGEGYNTISLVKRTKELATANKYDQVWCVFDKDDFNNQDFNAAITLANKYKFKIAYSNQSFEYWIILHLDDHQGCHMNRDDYNEKINTLLKQFGLSYDGQRTKIITKEIFELLEGTDNRTGKERKRLAIERAKRNYNQWDHKNPAKEESSTTIFKLVTELLKYI